MGCVRIPAYGISWCRNPERRRASKAERPTSCRFADSGYGGCPPFRDSCGTCSDACGRCAAQRAVGHAGFGECHEAVHVSFRVMAADGGQSRAAGLPSSFAAIARWLPESIPAAGESVHRLAPHPDGPDDRRRRGVGSIGRGRRVERMTRAWRCAAIRRRVVGGAPLPCAGAGRVDSPCRTGGRADLGCRKRVRASAQGRPRCSPGHGPGSGANRV